MNDITFVEPDITRDAPFALSWFDSPNGRQTLLSMGNAVDEINPPTLEGEMETLQSFISMESEGTQTSRMIRADEKTIGAVWIEWTENHGVQAPSIHVMIGDLSYRGQGIGTLALKEAIRMVHEQKPGSAIYTRHLANNHAIAKVLTSLRFSKDGEVYKDKNNLLWQHRVLEVNT